MSSEQLMSTLHSSGIQLSVSGNKLKLKWQGDQLEPDLHAEIARNKREIIRRIAPPVFVTLKSRSDCPLYEGGRKYAEDPTTEIVSCIADIDGKYIIWLPQDEQCGVELSQSLSNLPPREDSGTRIELFIGPELPEALQDVIEIGRCFCVHSAQRTTEEIWLTKVNPQPAGWINTFDLARARCLPGNLDQLGELLGYDSAVSENHVAIGCTQRQALLRPSGSVLIYQTQRLGDEFQELIRLRYVYSQLNSSFEAEVIQSDWHINHRGIKVDQTLVQNLFNLHEIMEQQIVSDLYQATNGTVAVSDLSRVEWLKNYLLGRGVILPDLKKRTVESKLRELTGSQRIVDPAVTAVLRARLQWAGNSSTRLRKMQDQVGPDVRVYDSFEYHKCHTGRWAGRGVQPQNLPKPHLSVTNIPALIERTQDYQAFQAALPEGVEVGDGISSLIRPCIVPASGYQFCMADFSSIEARGLAWCAGDESLLEMFRAGTDIYCAMASQIYPFQVTRDHERERSVGKIAVLGCGYGMSALRFDKYAADFGVDLASAGVTAEQVVWGYREAFPLVTGARGGISRDGSGQQGLWQNVEEATRATIQTGDPRPAGRCWFSMEGDALCITLPSSRKMYYRNARIEPETNQYRPSIQYDLPDSSNQTTYGGKLVENIVQAICRDLLAHAIVQCEKENLSVVLHVHDEIVIEVPECSAAAALVRLLQVMSTPPAWACGFPIEVTGFVAARYFKSPQGTTPLISAMNGSICH